MIFRHRPISPLVIEYDLPPVAYRNEPEKWEGLDQDPSPYLDDEIARTAMRVVEEEIRR